ncbi:MFS transporter [Dictyobacter vulcani]|uniref:MFS transporter n=1 Tax=Dictyobacter vulcani TaxID=2607529 RepID=A0A5J4KZI0_9CHLR|nr:MFS transporter [Dictyobacter vulcani]GER91937.1 MFS transporter [Dictyobacter vulcani]
MNSIQPSSSIPPAERPLWRNRDFLLLWNGQTISILGTNVSTLALPLLALTLTHSPAQAGFLAAMRLLPYLLLSLPAGALIDRWNRKTVMICCELTRWLALGSVPLVFTLGHLTLLHLYSVAFVEGTGYVFASLAQISALPRVVGPSRLAQAYVLDTVTESLGTLLGPGLGGFIIALTLPVVVLGACYAYLADSLSYLVSLLSLLCIRTSFQAERPRGEKRALHKEILEGLRFLWRQPLLRTMAMLTMTVNFLQAPLTLAVIILARNDLHLDVRMLGIMLGISGVGGLVGGLCAPWLQTRVRRGPALIGSVVLWSLAVFLLAIASSPLLVIIGSTLTSLAWPLYGVIVVEYRLTLTPDHLQGRVNSAFRFLTYGSEPLGTALGGLLLIPSDPEESSPPSPPACSSPPSWPSSPPAPGLIP